MTVPRPPGDVYSYVTDPRDLPTWAAGLAKSVEQRDGQWIVDSGTGEWAVGEWADLLATIRHDLQTLRGVLVSTN